MSVFKYKIKLFLFKFQCNFLFTLLKITNIPSELWKCDDKEIRFYWHNRRLKKAGKVFDERIAFVFGVPNILY